MSFSYWEYKSWFTDVDFTIVGSGIVGLNCALHLKKANPKAKILVLEKGILPQGASTKNAGFACFGSISEIRRDLESHSEDEVLELVQKRWQGIALLRSVLGDENLGYQQFGGHEIFLKEEASFYQNCLDDMDRVNALLHPVYGGLAFKLHPNSFQFSGVQQHYISNQFEGQIDTGKMMEALLKKVLESGVKIINSVTLEAFQELPDSIAVKTQSFEFNTRVLCVATNGFAAELLKLKVTPARAQVLVTKPIPNLKIKGTFHMQEGYYYFRNVDRRILLGGGRNLDFKTEATTEFGLTKLVQMKLEALLQEVIIPDKTVQIESRWSGIMGVGNQKKPIVKNISNRVYCGVRLGGMGIAIGSLVGKELADISS